MSEEGLINGRAVEIRVPLEQWVREIAREAAREAVVQAHAEFLNNCPAVRLVPQVNKNTEQIQKLTIRTVIMMTAAVASGVAGGQLLLGLIRGLGG